MPWANGDLIAVCAGCLAVLLSGLIQPRDITIERIILTMGNGVTLGPLLLIVLDPLNKTLQLVPIDLLQTAVQEARATLWFATFIATCHVVTSLLRSCGLAQPPATGGT